MATSTSAPARLLDRALAWARQLHPRTRIWLNDDLFDQLADDYLREFPRYTWTGEPMEGLFIQEVLFQPKRVRHIYDRVDQ